MSTAPVPPALFAVNLAEARRYWGWFVALGLLLMVLAIFALGSPFVVSVVAVVFYGVLLVIAGVGELVTAFSTRTWGGLFLHLLAAVLDFVVGVLFFSNPVEGSLVLTLFLGILFLIAGAARIAFAVAMQYPNWGWAVLSGFVTLLLGGIIWSKWPYSGLVFIGIAIGVELLMRGITWVMLGLALSSVPAEPTTPGTPTTGQA